VLLQESNYEGGGTNRKEGGKKKAIAAVWCSRRRERAQTHNKGGNQIKTEKKKKLTELAKRRRRQPALCTPLTPTLPLYYHIPQSLTLQTPRQQAIAAAHDVLQESNEESEEGHT
jgi:hypothetical protein